MTTITATATDAEGNQSQATASVFVLGDDQPDATNTGYAGLGLSAASLTDHFGDLIVTTNGAVIQNLRVHGIIELNANNCTVTGCEVVSVPSHAYPGTAHYGLISSSGTGNLIEYSHLTLFDPSTNTDNSGGTSPTWWMVGILITGGSCTVLRNDVSNVNDCVYLTGGTHQILGNYLHDNMFRTDDQDQSGSTPPDWSHNDGVQIMGGTNHLIQGNSFEQRFSLITGMNSTANPSPTAEQVWPNCHGILFSSSNNALTGITVDANWFKYGAACCHFTTGAAGGAATLTRNRFTPDQSKEFSVYTQIRIDPTTNWTASVDATNVYSNDSDTPVAWRGLPLKAPTMSGTVKVWQFNPTAHTP